ncbi:hypothetical protein Dsin_010036 [Dipteronia sinensis]|uniref:Endosulphine n=1 Tax=Dipteronia sinensis TaxID=43782 RepID=A0AAE0ECB0_9ROSI|nr:hypothetical protein Dsin_010036 [Dipteronia sinensis]
MSSTNADDLKEQEVTVDTTEKQVDVEKSVQEQSDSNKNDENVMPSTQQEEEIIKKKYGGMIPKKPPLISKDHERAFFDSADWALGKQGSQKPKGPLEALRPKLQPTPHQQMRSRRSAYAPADEEEANSGDDNTISSEDQTCALDGGNNKNNSDSQDQSSRE